MIDWKKIGEWAWAAFVRAVRTFAESALAYIGTGAIVLGDVNWTAVLSAGTLGFICAWFLALAGLPEVKKKNNKLPEPEEDEEVEEG